MELKEFGVLPKEFAHVSDDGAYPEAERGLNVCLHELSTSGKADTEVLFGDINVAQLKVALKSAANFVDYTKFELGNDWGYK